MEADDDISYYEQLRSNEDSFSVTQLPPSAFDNNGTSFFFTEEPNKLGWNNRIVVQENEQDVDEFEDHIGGKSFQVFENKLQKGFLEAPNLGLVSAPPAIFDYQPPLQRIDLKDNRIQILPEHFFDELPYLSWCDLRYNRLVELPELTVPHENLKALLLQDNQLTSLPYSLARAPNLHTLGWTNNEIYEPPRRILLQGCHKILSYLRDKLIEFDQAAADKEEIKTDPELDKKLREDLAKTAEKRTAKRTVSRNSLVSNDSGKSASDLKKEEDERKKRIDRLKYTWNLWKNIPYNGVSNHTLFEKSVQEVKDEVKAKLNQHKEAVLQKMKDNDALGKWRLDTRMMQMKGPAKPYDGVQMPFGTEADNACETGNQPHEYGHEVVDAATFRLTMAECMKKLQTLAENPAPISDTEKSLQRLKEVEDVQRKLFDMKLKWSVKSSQPI